MQFQSDGEPLLPKHVAVKLLQLISVDGLYFLTVYRHISIYVIQQCINSASRTQV